MFEVSQPVLLLDYLRVPYSLADVPAPPGFVGVRAPTGSRLVWPAPEASAARAEWFEFEGLDLLAHRQAVPNGERGIPFSPDDVMTALWSEAYTGGASRRGVKRAAMLAYYRARPLLPRRAQIRMRRAFSRVQARTRFPRWPIETRLHDLYDLVLGELAALADEPVPWVAPWPDGKAWAMVLTHDVERQIGYSNIEELAAIEREAGYRSSWNLVPERDYKVEDELVRKLQADGFEVGVHGLHHDGRDLESERVLRERLPAIRRWAERWGAVGFRSPATHRDWRLMPILGFEYDSSSPDTDPYEPQAGGCCTWWPFANGTLIELPITLVQDHTAFVILGCGDESLWVEKAEALRSRGGMALVITHPDYMLDDGRLASYRRYLERYAGDVTAWKALPAEVASWWRRRNETTVERVDGEWRAAGAGAGEARVALVSPPSR